MDYLQDTFERVVSQAFRDFGVSQDAWHQIEGQPMKWMADGKNQEPLGFFIENSTQSEFHICIYQNDRKLYDHTKDTLDSAKNFIFEKFQISKDAWKRIG